MCRQNICYHDAAFCDSRKSDMQHEHVLKNFDFDLRSGGGGRYVGKMFATMLLHFVIRFNLICNMPMF